jgi:hypothetical protein
MSALNDVVLLIGFEFRDDVDKDSNDIADARDCP